MKSVIRWAVQNTPAMNTLMVSVLLVGAFSLWTMRREVFPEFELEIIMVSVPYPGASPSEVEEGICQKIEEAVRTIDGIKKQTAIAAEGVGSMVLELNSDVKDVQKVLGEVRSEIDRISTFPERAEDPEVKQITMREAVIHVGVVGPDVADPQAEWYLRELAERVREELIALPAVSQAEIKAAKNYQIDVEISEDTLREHGLTLSQVSQLIRRNNLELPAGTIKTDSQDVLVKGKNKSLTGEGIAELPVLTQPGGTVLTVGDLATVRDEFDDTTAMTRVNGKPAMVISVERTSKEDLLAMTSAVRDYVQDKAMPAGYDLMYWGDRSVEVRDRLNLLKKERPARAGSGVHHARDFPRTAAGVLGGVGDSRFNARGLHRADPDRPNPQHALQLCVPDGLGDHRGRCHRHRREHLFAPPDGQRLPAGGD